MYHNKKVFILGMLILVSAIGFCGAITLKNQLDQQSKGLTNVSIVEKNPSNPNAVKTTYVAKNTSSKSDPAQKQKDIDALADAVLSNNMALVKDLIENKKVDVNAKSSEGIYPLENVLIFDNVEMAEFLIEKGANPDLLTSTGKTVREQVLSGVNSSMREVFQ